MSEVYDWMKALQAEAPEEKQPVDVAEAYARYQAEMAAHKPGRRSWRAVFSAPQWSIPAAVCALVLLIALTPVRTLGQRFLESLRIQKLAVVQVGNASWMRGAPSSSQRQALSQLISDNVVVTMKTGPALTVPDVATAVHEVGFAVEELSGEGVPTRIQVEDQGAFQVTLDADKIRAVLEEAGRSDIEVPDSVSGSMVAVHVSKGVNARYGNCGGDKESPDDTCLDFMQIPSPHISVPAGLNMGALAAAWLQLTGLSASEADQVARTIDWSSTLVIPVPHETANYQTISVDGVNGILIQGTPLPGGSAANELIWLKEGVIHVISARGEVGRVLAAAGGLGH